MYIKLKIFGMELSIRCHIHMLTRIEVDSIELITELTDLFKDTFRKKNYHCLEYQNTLFKNLTSGIYSRKDKLKQPLRSWRYQSGPLGPKSCRNQRKKIQAFYFFL